MTNKDYILKITDSDKKARIAKIVDCITKDYVIQSHGTITNIVIPAKYQENKTTIMAHHDLFPGSKGYNDNSTGVVTLLKLQEHLNERIELVFTDQEEWGGRGCEYYLQSNARPKQAINVDVVGLGDKVFYENYAGNLSCELPPHLEYFPRIPFSDSHMLRNYRIPNILLLTGKDKRDLIPKIFEAQHCNKNDGNMDLISEDVMELVFNTIVGMLEEL